MGLFSCYSKKEESSHGRENAKEAGCAVVQHSAAVVSQDGRPQTSVNTAL